MARSALKWSTRDLAAAARLAVRTVFAFESGAQVREASVVGMRLALEAQGIEFITGGVTQPWLKPPT